MQDYDSNKTYQCFTNISATNLTKLMYFITKSDVLDLSEIQDNWLTPFEINKCNSAGWTALQMAICNCNFGKNREVIQIILQHDVNIDFPSSGWTPLMTAARYLNSIDIIKQILEHNPRINFQDKNG